MSSQLIFEFKSIKELNEHLKHMAELESINKLIKKPEPNPFDGRGLHIKELHKKAKEYHALHPEIKYHQCMSFVCKMTDTSV